MQKIHGFSSNICVFWRKSLEIIQYDMLRSVCWSFCIHVIYVYIIYIIVINNYDYRVNRQGWYTGDDCTEFSVSLFLLINALKSWQLWKLVIKFLDSFHFIKCHNALAFWFYLTNSLIPFCSTRHMHFKNAKYLFLA